MNETIKGILASGITILLILVQCGTDEVSGIEVTNGTCVGTIYTKDNNVAAGAVVRLIPSGYDPLSSNADEIMTTETNAEGHYSFTVTKTDFYNVIAEKGSASCMQDSLSLLADAGGTIDPDTLEESGWLAGRIEVKPGNDPSRAVLLIPGTYQYTSPYDSLGNFDEFQLPAGTYLLKIFTTENGYAVLDTTVTVISGDTTWLSARIPVSYSTEVQSFNAQFDGAMMVSNLRWNPGDTARFSSYALHRYVNGIEDSIIIVDRSMSEFTDDLIFFLEDTITYSIAAVGDNYKEGYPAGSDEFIVSQKTGVAKSVLIDGYPASEAVYSAWWISENHTKESCIYSNNKIMKIDEDGNILQEIADTAIIASYLREIDSTNQMGLADGSISSVSCDTGGHIYVDFSTYSNGGTRFIHKLDEQFNLIASLDILGSVCEPGGIFLDVNYWDLVVVGDDGYVYLHNFCGSSTTIQVYDDNFNYIDEYTFDYYVRVRRSYGDTVLATTFIYPDADIFDENSEYQRIMVFDRSFNLLTSYESMHIYSLYTNLMEYPGRQAAPVYPVSSTLCMSVIECGINSIDENGISRMIIVVYNNSGKLIGRLNMPGDFNFSVNSSGELSGLSTFSGPYLYRVNLNALLSN